MKRLVWNVLLALAALGGIALACWRWHAVGYKEGWNAKGEEIDRLLDGLNPQDWHKVKPVPPEEVIDLGTIRLDPKQKGPRTYKPEKWHGQ